MAVTMHVFVPTDMRTKILQEKLEAACPQITITVFGRGQDFLKQVQISSPDAILTLIPVIENSSGYQSIFLGLKNGASTEPYILVSKDKNMEIKNLSDKSIGVVDLLGRKPMTDFVHQLLQQKVKVKRVTKREDLLPLLTFNAVDAIFVSKSIYASLTEKSQLNLVPTEVNVKVGLTAAATNNNADKDKLGECIKNFDAQLNATLGVEKWTKN